MSCDSGAQSGTTLLHVQQVKTRAGCLRMRTKPFFHTDERNRRRQLPIIKQQRHLFLPLLTPQHRFSHSRKHGDSQRHSQKTGGLERAKDQIRQIDRAAPYASTSRHNPYRTRAAPVAPYLTQKDVSCVCARRASGRKSFPPRAPKPGPDSVFGYSALSPVLPPSLGHGLVGAALVASAQGLRTVLPEGGVSSWRVGR